MDDAHAIEIFAFIVLSALLSFGGGNGQIPIIQGQWVDTGVLDPGLFAFAVAVTYLTPGPKAGFVAGVGYYLAGALGAVAAMLGLVVATTAGAGAVSHAMKRVQRVVALVRPASGFLISALIAAAAWGTAAPMGLHTWELAGVGLVAVGIGWQRLEPLVLILGAVGIGLLLSVVLG